MAHEYMQRRRSRLEILLAHPELIGEEDIEEQIPEDGMV